MFTPQDLADLRADSLAAMDAEATIIRLPVEDDPDGTPGYGFPAVEPEPVGDPIPCRVVPNGAGSEQNTGGTPAAVAPWIVQLDGIVTVLRTDVIAVAWPDGRTARYSVELPDTPRSYQVNTRVACSLVS